MCTLLAVDLGVKTGLASFGRDGRLVWYRSRNYGTAARLRRGVLRVLGDSPNLAWVVLEGGGALADMWEHGAQRRGISVLRVSAEEWRRRLLHQREQRSGLRAKRSAAELARRIIEWSDAPRPTSLRHDAAEAILVGLWGVLEVGWLRGLPAEVRH